MASIEATSTGPDGRPSRRTRWRARYRDPGGRSRSRTFERKIDAQQFLTGIEADIDRGRWADPQLQRTTFETWADRWLETLHVRPSTRHGYLHGLRRLRRRFAGQRISAIDRAEVRAFIADMRRAGYAPKTIRSTILVLKLVLDLPLEDKVIFENPAVRQKLGSSRLREPVFLTAQELRALADAAGPPWTALILFAGYTGLRPAELAGLRAKRLDLLRGRAEIRDTLTLVSGHLVAGPTKTYETRTVPLPAFLRELMAAHLAHRVAETGRALDAEDFVFLGHQGGPLRSDKLQRLVIRPAARSIGLPAEFRTYDLRHTCASLLIAAGAHPRAIMERLGHKDIKTTLNVYGHLFPELQGELNDRLDSIYQSGSEPTTEPATVHELTASAATRRS